MFGVGFSELCIIFMILFLLFGSRLPSVAKSIGESIREFQRARDDK
jgi:TatA/E family protein of Tat protein translocase